MLRPENFSKPHRTVSVVPYQMITSPSDLPEPSSSNGGVFHRGQIVWTQKTPSSISVPHAIIGFVDGLGHVVIDSRVLRSVEASTHTSN